MKIIVPEYALPTLREKGCPEAHACEYIAVDREGQLSGPIEGAEVLMMPWTLSNETKQAILDLPTLKWVHLTSAGVEHVLDDRMGSMDITLTNASGVFDLPIAETVLTYILMILKRMPEFLEQQSEKTWKRLRLREAAGLTVGVIGAGSIGTEIARLCKGLGMRVIATRRHPERGALHADTVLPQSQLETLLAGSDFVVIAVPRTPETTGMIGAAQLKQMRPGAWLINIARGAIVDEPALIRALQAKEIAGAALDVFAEEPLPPDSPLWAMDNILIMPHNSWSTPHLEMREAAIFLENLTRYLHDEPLLTTVNKTLGY